MRQTMTKPKIEQRVSTLEKQVDLLLKGRPGRQLKPIVVSEAHVCGIDPERDSTTCEDASLWRRSKGCKGDACMGISSQYYKDYRAKKRTDESD
jgi:hypothetical protein